jgi:hypothetical protein
MTFSISGRERKVLAIGRLKDVKFLADDDDEIESPRRIRSTGLI